MGKPKWYMSAWSYGTAPAEVDREAGILRGVAVVTAGEVRGHGVMLDTEFVQEAVRYGNEKQHGIKVRFGHPNMFSTALGTFLGRAKNFRADGGIARADIFLSKEAQETPHGNLYDYVLRLAADSPDMFGASIVFTPGAKYWRDATGARVDAPPEPGAMPYVELSDLHAADLVDDPAANPDGLFSAWNSDTLAGQVTEFLDTHPQVWVLLAKNPGIVEDFTARYRRYLERGQDTHTEDEKMENATADAAAVETPEAEEEKPELENEPGEIEELEAVGEPEENAVDNATDATAETVEMQAEPAAVQLDVLRAMVEEFGANLAAQVLLSGGGRVEAMAAQAKILADENAKLRAENVKLTAAAACGERPVSFADADADVGEPAAQPKRLTAAEAVAAKIRAETKRN